MNPAISVIVPVYNVEAYVRKSLQSIADQTFTDWECIVVDDGSTDGSGAICDEFAARDPRFKVIHQQNQGLPGARNTGLAVAQGRYIGFIDSDDYIHPDMYQVLLTAIEQTDSDIAMVQTRKVSSLDQPFLPNPPIEYRIMNREQLFYHWFVEPFVTKSIVFVWNKLYKRGLIGSERFEDITPCEDYEFNILMILRCKRTVIANQVMHHWVMRKSSICHHAGVASHQYKAMLVIEYCGIHCLEMTEKERGYYKIDLMKRFLKARRASKDNWELNIKVKKERNSIKEGFFTNSAIQLKYKVVLGIMFYCPWIYDAFIEWNEFKARCHKSFETIAS